MTNKCDKKKSDLPALKGIEKSLLSCPLSFKNLSGLKFSGSPQKSGSLFISLILVIIIVLFGIKYP